MINKLSIADLMNGIFIFLFGLQVATQSYLWILPIDTSELFGHSGYILGSLLILKSIFIIKINLYRRNNSHAKIDFGGFFSGLFVLIYGAYVLQDGWLHARGSRFYLELVNERYIASLVLISSGIYMISHSYVLMRKRVHQDN